MQHGIIEFVFSQKVCSSPDPRSFFKSRLSGMEKDWEGIFRFYSFNGGEVKTPYNFQQSRRNCPSATRFPSVCFLFQNIRPRLRVNWIQLTPFKHLHSCLLTCLLSTSFPVTMTNHCHQQRKGPNNFYSVYIDYFILILVLFPSY